MAKTVGLLLAAGADANARNDNGGRPLDNAASWLEPEAVRLLLAAGAVVDAPGHGHRTPLVSAACTGNAGAVELLLQAGAYAWAVDDYGVTARQCAANGRERAAEDAKHPDPFPLVSPGPFKKDFDRVLKLLEEAGAKRKR
jgi:hypothetical protein